MIGALRNIVPGAESAATAMMEFDVFATAAITGASTGIIGLGVAAALGFGALIMWMLNTKNATQQWVDSLEQSVNAAQGLQQIGQTYTSLGQVTSALTGAQKQLNTALAAPGGQIVGSMTRFQGYSDAVEASAVKVGVLSQAQQQLTTDFGTEVGNVDLLSSKYKIGYVEAAELAGDAGANLTQTMKGNTTAAQINPADGGELRPGSRRDGRSPGRPRYRHQRGHHRGRPSGQQDHAADAGDVGHDVHDPGAV